MPSASIRFTVPPEIGKWQRSFAAGPALTGKIVEQRWQVGMDVLLARSQDVVHVISGALKGSGRSEVTRDASGQVTGIVEYGNETVDYAIYEHARGGEHAFLTRAYEAAEADLSKTLPDVWNLLIASWRV